MTGGVGLDTSVVVRLLTSEPQGQAEAARDRLASHFDAGEDIVVTDLTVAEAYFALHHHYGVPKVEALALLHSFVTSGVVKTDPPGLDGRLAAAGGGAGLVDRLIHGRHRDRGLVTLTFDRRLAALAGADLVGGR